MYFEFENSCPALMTQKSRNLKCTNLAKNADDIFQQDFLATMFHLIKIECLLKG